MSKLVLLVDEVGVEVGAFRCASGAFLGDGDCTAAAGLRRVGGTGPDLDECGGREGESKGDMYTDACFGEDATIGGSGAGALGGLSIAMFLRIQGQRSVSVRFGVGRLGVR